MPDELFDTDAQVMDNRTKEVAISPSNELIKLALDKNADPSVIERLVDLANKQEDRRAKQEFDLHFSAMQAELPVITKNKEAKKDQEIMYLYAPLETLQRECNPIIAKYGFSYSWREEATEKEGKRTILAIRGYGHIQENYFDAPQIQGNARMNPIQVAGAMSTYGRRYTFIAGFGLTVEGEDDDAKLDNRKKGRLIDSSFTALMQFANPDTKDAAEDMWDGSNDKDKPAIFKKISRDVFYYRVSLVSPTRAQELKARLSDNMGAKDILALIKEAANDRV